MLPIGSNFLDLVCESSGLLLVDAAEVVVTSTEDSPVGVAWSGACEGEPLKARTAAWAAADAALSIVSFKDPCTRDCTWVSCVAERSPSCGDSRSRSSWTWRWSCWNCISIAFWFAMCSPPSWIGGGVPRGCLCLLAVPRRYALSGQHVRLSLGDWSGCTKIANLSHIACQGRGLQVYDRERPTWKCSLFGESVACCLRSKHNAECRIHEPRDCAG